MTTIINLPPITEAHLRTAFEAMNWHGWTFEAAMGNDMRARLIRCRAHQLRTREYCQALSPSPKPVRRVRLDAAGNAASWCTQIVMGPREVPVQPDLLTPPTKT